MKKMNLVLGALLVSGMVFAGGRANEQEIALAAQATETEDTGIRAEAPQESSAQTDGMTGRTDRQCRSGKSAGRADENDRSGGCRR